MQEIVELIKQSFNALWQVKGYDRTIEIITPFITTNDCFVSVFLTERNGYFIITDGGWIDENYYNNFFDSDDEYYLKLFVYYKDQYSVLETESGGRIYYYKKVDNKKMVPNLILEMSNFISTIISSSFVKFQENKDKDLQKRFGSEVNDYIYSISNNKKNLHFNGVIDSRFRDIKFNAVLTTNDRHTLINYVTGTSDFYFRGSIGRSNMNFQLINRTPIKNKIKKRITVVNDQASGYKIDRLKQYLELISSEAESEIINWSEKTKMLECVE